MFVEALKLERMADGRIGDEVAQGRDDAPLDWRIETLEVATRRRRDLDAPAGGSTDLALELVERNGIVPLLPSLGGTAILLGRCGLVVDRRVLEQIQDRVAVTAAGDDLE